MDGKKMIGSRTNPVSLTVNTYMRNVYKWMTLGLVLTSAIAYMVLNTPAFFQFMVQNKGIFFGMLIAELGIVFYLSARINKLSAGTATGLFLLYSALNGVTISLVLAVYTAQSVFAAFVTCSGMFAAMSVYGHVTKKDLTSWGSFLFMGLIGLLIAMLVNIFLQSSAMQMVISFAGVIIFTGLTAYDTQKLKEMGESAPLDDAVAMRRGVILGALTLYLDFVNLFLMLLRLFGGNRN